MPTLHATAALLETGIRRDVRIAFDGQRITSIQAEAAAEPSDERVGLLLPGMASLHSHAFQRGMAGLAEMPGPAEDSFWTWRETMYRFALATTPDQLESIAAQLYVEMLETGFTRVGEFHYLHHDRDGRHFSDIGEMAARICAAAGETGIGLTLLPAFYAHATFGGAPPATGQRRFVNDLDSYGHLLEASRRHTSHLDGANIGVAPHSLRAVSPTELATVVALATDGPVHIHAAEQTKEIEDCLAWSGRRPVEWLLDNAGIDHRWCLVHATHMTSEETTRLAASGATAGLCPVTEANLGDGIFNGRKYQRAGGRFGIGTDSNILVGVADELRHLEYSQRLNERVRNVISQSNGSTGRTLYEMALSGGARALGLGQAGLSAGTVADLVAIDLDKPTFAGVPTGQLLDAWIFASRGPVESVWVSGRKRVQDGRHIGRDGIEKRFASAMKELASA